MASSKQDPARSGANIGDIIPPVSMIDHTGATRAVPGRGDGLTLLILHRHLA